MTDIEEIKRKKLEELQRMQQEALQGELQEQAQMQQQINMLENMVKPILTKQALERYGRLKIAHTEKAVQLLVVLVQLMQQGTNSIDDNQLKDVLTKITPAKKEFRIKRK